jgi:hypothetical protein
MKAILEFNLPEEQEDHAYAIHGVDALLVISDLEQEIRSKLRHDCGEFKEFEVERYCEGSDDLIKKRVEGCDDTLQQVWDVLIRLKRDRNLPELV